MTNTIKYVLCCVTLMFIVNLRAVAQTPKPILLFPNGVPDSKKTPADYIETTDADNKVSKVTEPSITPFFPANGKSNGTAVVICPGGAYALLSMKHEGFDVAQKLSELGITAFVLKYRLPSDLIMDDKTIGPLQDAQRAIQLIRQNAVAWQVDPNKVGIMGFSAGGHLASSVGTHYDKVLIDNRSNISFRPDFMVLLYPVISFGEYGHQGSKRNLISLNPSPELVQLYSNELQVTDNTPPTFLVHAGDDKIVKVQNSIIFYEALLAHHVKAELHLYQAGGHGFGLINPATPDAWFDRYVSWMKQNAFL